MSSREWVSKYLEGIAFHERKSIMSSSEWVSKYLERIAFHEQPDVSLACLSRLQACHQLSVPFENLDVFLGRHIILDVDLLYEKIVLLKRGGWCCELNGMFWWLLTKLGFNVKLISCSHYNEDSDTFDENFDHLALVVIVADVDYLVDVGYGHINQHIKPLKITKDVVGQQAGGCYKLLQQKDGMWYLQHRKRPVRGHHRNDMDNLAATEYWYTMYRFTTISRQLTEFQFRCTQYETDPNMALSYIPKAVIKSNGGKGIKLITGTRFTTVDFKDGVNIRTNFLNSKDEELKELLEKEFGILLNELIPFNKIMCDLKREYK